MNIPGIPHFTFSAFAANPIVWAAAAGILLGATVNALIRSITENRTRLKMSFFVWADLLIICLVCAAFFAGFAKFADTRVIIFFLFMSVLSFLACFFKKSFGTLFLILMITSAGSFFLFLQAVTAFTGETKIAEIQVIDTSDGMMQLEMQQTGLPHKENISLKGDYFAPVVKLIIFDDLLVFFGTKTSYRFIGLTSFNGTGGVPVQASIYNLPRPDGISEKLYRFVEKHEKNIPGVKSAQIDIVLKKARAGEVYRVMVQNDGGIEVQMGR